jgi:octaheme c-type cytochrome (tetrathionate reductase family)
MRFLFAVIAIASLLFITSGAANAAQDHSGLINGPFKTGQDVTKACLQCHEKQAQDFMKTVHWTWSSKQQVPGRGLVDLGKKNAINNYCIALPSNEPRCTSCHAGYGWKDKSFDFSKAENIDCLVCHDTTGSYRKLPAAAGLPAYQDTEFPPKSGKIWKKVDLEKMAKKVGPTSRQTCGSCHFFGGGGDHIKHGDLDSSLTKPTRSVDVHMAADGANMTCSSCHKAVNHVIPGKALSVSVAGSGLTLNCTDCHAGTPHGKNTDLNRHTAKIACQTCHAPTYAKALPTKTWWDWSTAGKDMPIKKDKYGQPLYDKQKGDFRWAKDEKPVYMWFNGSVDRYLLGDKMDPGKMTHLNYPKGSRLDKDAKITPFKIMRGKQPYDSGNAVLAVPQLWAGYWKHWSWDKAIADGMKTAGLPYSGKFGFAETDMYWKVNHMVAPKTGALKCNDCHAKGGRMDWKALGYKGDPSKKKK